MNHRLFKVIFLLFIINLILFSCSGKPKKKAVSNSTSICTSSWTEYSANPLIDYGDSLSNIFWNDPSVLKEGDTYRMWMTGGRGIGVNFVEVYTATSSDGLSWSINTTPVFAPRTDTPVMWVIATNAELTDGTPISGIGDAYILSNEDSFGFTRAVGAYGVDWHIFKHSDNEFYLSSNTTGAGVGLGGSQWKCVDSDLVNGPNCPTGYYEPVIGTNSAGTLWAQTATDATYFDSEKTETPSVIKIGSTYHMFYSSFKLDDPGGRYQIGHATSSDGMTWVRESQPAIAYHGNSADWGFYQAAEPGAVYNPDDGKIYLYYVTAKAGSGSLPIQQGIAVATTTDGTTFRKSDGTILTGSIAHEMALTQSSNYPISNYYAGYSTPNAMIDSNGLFHLFYDVAQYQDYPTNSDWRQVAIAHATSTDGYNFTEIESDIFVFGNDDWMEHEVRAPMALEEDDVIKLWFAGSDMDFPWQPGMSGIGYATYSTTCK